MIICWKNDFERVINVRDKLGKNHLIEIMRLSKVVKEKKLKVSFKEKPPTHDWDEMGILRKKNSWNSA